eukprot:m.341423 g.341423  ORF g.341423 m.341423 type:complete len:324 (-) comp55767_c0_seq1:134-1105(-)
MTDTCDCVADVGAAVGGWLKAFTDLNLPETVFGAPLAAQITQAGEDFLTFINPEITDSPTKDWLFCDFQDAFFVAAAYLVFVLLGSTIMKLIFGSQEAAKEATGASVIQKIVKEPVMLLVLVYNPVQVILCGYMIYAAIAEFVRQDYTLICNAFNPKELGMASVLLVFYLSKILDFVDTLVIIVRRKWRQLSFLHVYHHISIFLVYWMNMRVGYDGDIYYTIVLNSFVHFVMYAYYELTAFNIPVPKPIKKLVTNLQMIQFVTMNVQAITILVLQCDYPARVTVFYLVYILSLLFLFNDFSSKTYKADGKGSKQAAKESKKTQ